MVREWLSPKDVKDIRVPDLEAALLKTCVLFGEKHGTDRHRSELAARTLLASVASSRHFMAVNGRHLKKIPQAAEKCAVSLLWTAPLLEPNKEIYELGDFMAEEDVRDMHFEGKPREFCWVLNEILRSNDQELVEAAMPIMTVLNSHCVEARSGRQAVVDWGNNDFFRGICFNMEFKDFFQEGKEFRTPSFLATTADQSVATNFMRRAQPGSALEPLMFVIHVHPTAKPMHVNFMEITQVMNDEGIPTEKEFLYSPFSAFRVEAVHWREEASLETPHVVEIFAFPDNQRISETLPLAPWI